MASTFTGLKLQGQIGKFGAKEISDIEGQWKYIVKLELHVGQFSTECQKTKRGSFISVEQRKTLSSFQGNSP